MKTIPQINQIYFFRFLAAMMVVFYHFCPLSAPFSYGNEAVHFFFFLSGYILTLNYLGANFGTRRELLKFYFKRLARIYPVYLLALLFTILINLKAEQISVTWARFLPELVMLQSWFGKSSINSPAWSLSVELSFYLSFPFLLTFLKHRRTLQLISIAVGIYLMNTVAGYLLLPKFNNSKFFLQYFPPVHLCTFTLGIIAGLFFLRNKSRLTEKIIHYKILFYFLSLVFFVFLCYTLGLSHVNNGWLTPSYGLFIIALSLPSRLTQLISSKIFVWSGEISYSIYILQAPVWIFFKLFIPFPFMLYILLLIAVCGIVYQFYEVPLKSFILNKISLNTSVKIPGFIWAPKKSSSLLDKGKKNHDG